MGESVGRMRRRRINLWGEGGRRLDISGAEREGKGNYWKIWTIICGNSGLGEKRGKVATLPAALRRKISRRRGQKLGGKKGARTSILP